MADSKVTSREADKKLFAEVKAIIANRRLAETPVDTAEPATKTVLTTNYIITKARSDLYGCLPRDRFLAFAKAMAKNVDFSHESDEPLPSLSISSR